MEETENKNVDPTEMVNLDDFDESNDTENYDFDPLYHQILAAVGPILLTIFGALVSGYSAILLPQLKAPDSIINPTTFEESWIASLAILPMAIGCIIGGWSMDKHGRVNANIISAMLAMIGWGFIYYATNIPFLLIGRLISGLAVGVACPGATCFLGEVSHPKYRGFFLSLTALAISLGFLIVHLLGTFLHWKTVAAICAMLPIICIGMFAVLPESHAWHLKRGDYEKARRTFFWYRGKNRESIEEFAKIILDKKENQERKLSGKELFGECCKAQFLKPFFIMNLYFIASQVTGINAVGFYTVSIMKQTVPSLDKYTSTILVDCIRVFMSVVGCVLTKKYKIRPLTIISGLGVAFSLYFLSLFVYLSGIYTDSAIIKIMPMVGFVGYMVFICIGLMPLPWAICSELFPPATRGIGGGISICNNFYALFVVVKTSPDMFENLGIEGTFITYASMVLFCTAILYYVLPETKNKTLTDIEALFTKKTKTNGVL